MLPSFPYTTHSPLIPLQEEYRMDTDREATHSAIFSISLPRHLYKICDTEVHAAPPFTIFTTVKIYDPSPQLSVTQNVTFQPQEKHTATKYGQQWHGTTNANRQKRLPIVVYSVKFRGQPETLNLNVSPPILPPCTHTNIHKRIYYNVQIFLTVVYLVFVFYTSYHVFYPFSALL